MTGREYRSTPLREEIVINKIITVHYFEYVKDYSCPRQSHDFWEFLYVDKGTVDVTAGTIEHTLNQGDIIFHKPNEWHNVQANGQVAPNLVVVSFECDSSAMDFFDGKRMRIGDTEKNLLARIIREATHAFSSRLNDPNLKYLDKKETPDAFACEQIIKLSLELMLIEMIRKALQGQGSSRLSTSVRENSDQEVLQKILAFLQENVRGKISLDDVCAHTLFSRSYIQRMFKHQTGSSIMDYYKRLKIEEAKLMIREGKYNFTQISELLSYASIHHFSRHFKEITGMTPSEYASSVKVKI